MKTMSVIFTCLLTATTAFAGNEPDICNRQSYPKEIASLLTSEKPFFKEDLSGVVTIRFTVDQDKAIHIVEVESTNLFLKSHALEALEGKQMETECLPDQEVYEITVKFNYAA